MNASESNTPLGHLLLLIPLSILAIAFFSRLTQLEARPMHGDEANQAVKAGALLDEGFYRYDPLDHHGPTLYYFSLVSARLFGQRTFIDTSERTFRVVPALFGIGIVILILLLRNGLGTPAAWSAALLAAVSPAQTYYSRYFIQETLLVFFTLALLLCGWRYLRRPGLGWAFAAGTCIGLMHATKETSVIAWAAIAAALVATRLWKKRSGEEAGLAMRPVHLAAAIALAVAVSVTLYSSFFTYARGPLDSILTYGHYLQQGGEPTLHEKPWTYYLAQMAYVHNGAGPHWSEAMLLLLALIGAIAILRFPKRLVGDRDLSRFLLLFATFMTVVYSALPYKTPWTMLSLHIAIVLIAGIGMAALLRYRPRIFTGLSVKDVKTGRVRVRLRLRSPAKGFIFVLCIVGIAHLAYQSWLANARYPADPRNPYVYAHTSPAFMKLVDRIEDIAAVHPDSEAMLIHVIQPDEDYWPIPWYLRRFERVGYWKTIPDSPDAAIIIADRDLAEALDAQLQENYVVEMHGLRPSVLRSVYIREDLWKAFIETRKP
ncbi:MAG: TIGR03663 family protein [Candidatus Hydrogenedentes bacterium]|nr:TIGR03663 family protein [Candidatus Hydrogenedentota bacterium]